MSEGSCASAALGHSVPSTLYYGNDASCTFDSGHTEGVVRSPVVSLAVAQGAQVEFSYFLGTEGGGFYDRASVDGGPFQFLDSNFSSAPEPDLPVRRRPGAASVCSANGLPSRDLPRRLGLLLGAHPELQRCDVRSEMSCAGAESPAH